MRDDVAGPPMGWNSWDCYGTTVTEAEVVANAEFIAERLLPHGWDTVVVDALWSDPTARSHGYNVEAPLELDAFGRLLPTPVRFPSAAGGAGFAPLARRLHESGLRFGIHVMRGIPRRAVALRLPILGTDATADEIADPGNTCEWNPDMFGLRHDHPAAQAYYDSLLALYAEWEIDFLKADDLLWPYQARDIEAFATAVGRSGREIRLSLSPGRDLSLAHLGHLRRHAELWRICDDVWDRWEDVVANFARFARWAPHAGAGGWPDGDMLPIGRIGIRAERGEPRESRLTPDEQVSMLTLWVIARSPLMIGGDLPSSSESTIGLLSNPDVYEIARASSRNRELLREDDIVVWCADGPGRTRYAAVFNLADRAKSIVLDGTSVGFPAQSDRSIRELWTGAILEPEPVGRQSDAARGVAPGSSALRLEIPPHGARLLRLGGDR